MDQESALLRSGEAAAADGGADGGIPVAPSGSGLRRRVGAAFGKIRSGVGRGNARAMERSGIREDFSDAFDDRSRTSRRAAPHRRRSGPVLEGVRGAAVRTDRRRAMRTAGLRMRRARRFAYRVGEAEGGAR